MIEKMRRAFRKIWDTFCKREFDRVPKGSIIESDFDIIKALADAKGPLRASEIHERIGGKERMTRQNLHKRLNSLNDSGYVEESGSRWRLAISPRREIYISELVISFFSIIGAYYTQSFYPAIIGGALLGDLALRWFFSGPH